MLRCFDFLDDKILSVILIKAHEGFQDAGTSGPYIVLSFCADPLQTPAVQMEDADRLGTAAAICFCHAIAIADADFP